MKTSGILLGYVLTCLGFVAGGAGAQVVTEFGAGITSAPIRIAAGPDGNVWFTEPNADRIGRITPLGFVTEFSAGITAGAYPYDITAGPDGNLWFTEPGNLSLAPSGIDKIGRITPQGIVTEFSAGLSANARPIGITAGADGNLWFTEAGGTGIGRITPTGLITEFSIGLRIGEQVVSITAGPDGNLWFTACVPSRYGFGICVGRVGRITPLGVVSTVAQNVTNPFNITAGPDGNLWLTQGYFLRIGRVTPEGVVTEFIEGHTGGAFTCCITAGPDGNVWFTERGNDLGASDRIGRITPDGVVTEFSAGISRRAYPNGITAGPDGSLWFTEPGGNRIGRITPCQGACLPTTTSVVSSANPSPLGQAVVFTASVAGNFPSGTVQFMDGEAPLGSPVGLSGGNIAQLITSTLTKGRHAISAVYSGDNTNAPSESRVLMQSVRRRRD